MRIFLLPLTTRQALIYCQRGPVAAGTKPRLIDRVTTKAAETWAKWEDAESGWKKQVVTYGNRGLQRIPYQEWSLKSFPPSNPKLQAEQATDGKKFEVIYPGNVMHEEDVPKILARLARERKQLHWNRFIGSMVAMPFTIPFGLIPMYVPFFPRHDWLPKSDRAAYPTSRFSTRSIDAGHTGTVSNIEPRSGRCGGG